VLRKQKVSHFAYCPIQIIHVIIVLKFMKNPSIVVKNGIMTLSRNIYHPKWSHMHIPSWLFFSTMVAHDFWYGHFRFGYCMLMLHVVPTMFEEIESMNGLFICLSFFCFWSGIPFENRPTLCFCLDSQSGSADETLPLGCSRVNRPERGAVGTYWDHVGIGTDCEAGKEAIFHW
jgi:hypothetical protein